MTGRSFRNRKVSVRVSALVAAVWLSCGMTYAKPVSETDARQQAWQYLDNMRLQGRQCRAKAARPAELRLAYTAEGRTGTAFYVFNTPDGEGFVLAAADDCAAPVLGYSDNGPFDYDNMPDGLKGLLSSYERQIGNAVAGGAGKFMQSTPFDDRLDIDPLIATRWNQGEPYNALCPLYNGRSTLVGCVAVAMAQLMYYHQWPEQGRGSISYNWHGKTMTGDFSKAHFEWDKMKLSYNANTPDPNQAVATLMYYNALAATADFGNDLTYGYFDTQKLHLYFRYKDQMGWCDMAYSSVEEFDDILFDNLERGLPVLYRAADPAVWAHVFIVDGYRIDGYYHMNLGWGGSADGYYLLNVVNTPWANLDSEQMMVYNIEPESAMDGVEHTVLTPVARHKRVYNLQGQQVGSTTDCLPRGLYVIDGKKVMIR